MMYFFNFCSVIFYRVKQVNICEFLFYKTFFGIITLVNLLIFFAFFVVKLIVLKHEIFCQRLINITFY